jgi:hypothetical protein
MLSARIDANCGEKKLAIRLRFSSGDRHIPFSGVIHQGLAGFLSAIAIHAVGLTDAEQKRASRNG